MVLFGAGLLLWQANGRSYARRLAGPWLLEG